MCCTLPGNQLIDKDYQITSSFACWKAETHFSTSSTLVQANCSIPQQKVSNTTKALVCCKYTEHRSHVGWPFNGKLYNNRALAETYYLSLSAVIQTAVDPQHIQGLKKTRKNFTSAGRSHTNHIHKSIARHEQKASGRSTEHYSKLLPWTEIG